MVDQGAKVAAVHDIKRSSQWPTKRAEHLKKFPYCAACTPPTGWRKLLHSGKALVGLQPVQVHHIYPFHSCVVLGRADLELDDRNLITLCERGQNHHILVGHLGDFKSYNPDVSKHASHTFHAKTAAQIREDVLWKKLNSANPKDVDILTDLEKSVLRGKIDSLFPVVKS